MPVEFNVRFEGLDARDHQLEMRLLGRSLVGLDRVIHEGLFLAIEGRPPKQRERLGLDIRVAVPEPACVDINGIILTASGVLPIVHELIVSTGTEYISHFLSYVLTMFGGRRKEADAHIKPMLEAMQEMHAAELLDRQHERLSFMQNEDRWRGHTLEIIDRLRPPAQDIVAPIGSSAETLKIPVPGLPAPTVIDEPTADAIRAREPLEVGDMEQMTIFIDGYVQHNRTLKIAMPEQPGRFITADVRDPVFDQTPNAYSNAIGKTLDVLVKPVRRQDGELVKLYVMSVAGPSARVA